MPACAERPPTDTTMGPPEGEPIVVLCALER